MGRPTDRSDGIGLEDLKARVDIVELVLGYVPGLRKAGKDWKGLCPFHDEKTPSFYVIPEKYRYHCFGCGASGDAIKFLQEKEQMTFVEAADRLARTIGRRFYGRETKAERSLKDQVLEVNGLAAGHFADLLQNSPRASDAREYLAKRGLGKKAIKDFGLGYSLPEWEGLRSVLVGRGHTEGLLTEAGLLKQREGGSGAYDRFRGRIMFPIRTAQGDVIGFGARALGDDEPKYLNSPATPVFDKSRTFYGLGQALTGIRDRGSAMIVEGYTDVIACHQAGVANVVATLGTALTPDHLRVLRRYTSEALLAFDADSAGLAAMLRVADQLEGAELDVRVILLPEGEDPDSLVRTQGGDALAAMGDEAKPLYHFVIDAILPETGAAPDRGALDGVTQALARVRAPAAREQYVVYAADRICPGDPQRMTGMAEALRRQIRQARRSGRDNTRAASSTAKSDVASSAMVESALAEVPIGVRRREATILQGLAQESVTPKEVCQRVNAEDFLVETNREILGEVARFAAEGKSLDQDALLEALSEAAQASWTALCIEDRNIKSDSESVLDCLETMADASRRARLAELEGLLPELLAQSSRSERDEAAIREYMELKQYFSDRKGRDVAGTI